MFPSSFLFLSPKLIKIEDVEVMMMIKSMTGFARSIAFFQLGEEAKSTQLTIEIKAVNHRFCEVTVKAPKKLLIFEERIKRIIAERIKRGRIDVFINLNTELFTTKNVNLDLALARAYVEAVQLLKEQLGLTGEITVQDLIKVEGLFDLVEEESDVEAIWEWIEPSVREATERLDNMRAREGKSLAHDLQSLLSKLEEDIAHIHKLAPEVKKEYHQRLASRIAELLGPHNELDEHRLLTEVALFAEKTDINEELIRLASHCQQFLHTLHSETQVGRKLDFLIQEMNKS